MSQFVRYLSAATTQYDIQSTLAISIKKKSLFYNFINDTGEISVNLAASFSALR